MKEGWQSMCLGEVLEIRNGRNQREVESTSGEFPIYGSAGNLMGMATDYICEAGTTIIGRKGSINNPVYVQTRFWNVDTAFGLAAKEGLDSRFLYFFCLSYDFTAHNRGTTIPSLVKSELLQIEIAVPPLPEQQRIVALLDEAFAGLATAKSNAEQNLQNARALFDSHLQLVFSQRGEEWVEKSLKEICEKITDGTHQTPKYFSEGVVFLSSRNVTSGKIDWDNIKYIDNAQHLEMHRRVAPRRGDILLAKNGTTGVAAIVDRDTVFDIYVSLAHIRALPVIRPQLLLHFINSPAAKVQFNQRLKGVGVPNLHLEEIREVRLHFPEDLMSQDRLVAEVDELLEETQRLNRLYERKLAALEELKKSLLHQAFNGEL